MSNKRAQELCRQLLSVCMLTSDEATLVYTQVIDELVELQDPATLGPMMLCLRDVDAGEVQYELLEACEGFPKEVLVETVFEVGAPCLQNSPIWFGMLLQSLLNSPEYRTLFVSRFPNLDAESKLAFQDFFKRLAQRNSKYDDLKLLK